MFSVLFSTVAGAMWVQPGVVRGGEGGGGGGGEGGGGAGGGAGGCRRGVNHASAR